MIDSFNGKADITQIAKWYKLAKDEHADYRERAKKAIAFYFGEQWDASAIEELRKSQRPALTINKIKPIIRTLSGYMRQNRKDQRVAARRGGVDAAASIYTKVLKYIYDISYADWGNAMAFTDGIVGGKGWISVDRSFVNDPVTGDLIVSREDPFLIFEDPYAQRYDMMDARFIFRGRWMQIPELEMMFPKAKDYRSEIQSKDSTLGAEFVGSTVDDESNFDGSTGNVRIGDARYLVKECWYKEYDKIRFISINGADHQELPKNVQEDQVRYILTNNPAAKIVTRVMPKMRMAIVLGNLVLHEEQDPMNGSIRFPVVRFCNDFMPSGTQRVRGEVEDIIQPQEEHNKRRSQALHHMNTSTNSGWIVEEGAMSATEIRKLEAEGSKPGIVVQVKDGYLTRVQKITPVPMSEGHVTLSNLADSDMKAISGVNSDLLGTDKSNATSGIAMEMRRRQGLINVESVFDNYDFTQRVLGDTLLDYVRKTEVYTPEEIAEICGKGVKMLDGTMVEMPQIAEFMKSAKGTYAVTMSDMNNNPTIRQAEFMQMLSAMKEAGVQVPPKMVVEASDWSFKDELLATMEQQAQAQSQVPMQDGQQGQPSPQDAEAMNAEFEARYAQEQAQGGQG